MTKHILLILAALTFAAALTFESAQAQTNSKTSTPQSFSRTFQTDLNRMQNKMGLKNRRDMRQKNQHTVSEDDRTAGQSKTTNPQTKKNRRHVKKSRKAPSSAQNSSATYGSTLNN